MGFLRRNAAYHGRMKKLSIQLKRGVFGKFQAIEKNPYTGATFFAISQSI